MKVYVKRGNTNYKEKKLIRAIEAAIEKNPELAKDLTPATTFEQLRNMHIEYCADDVKFENVSKSTSDSTQKNEPEIEEVETVDTTQDMDAKQNQSEKTDPFNEEEPIVRDYVLKDDFANQDPNQNNGQPAKTTFNEPVTFGESFAIPDDQGNTNTEQKNNTQSKGNGGGGGRNNNNNKVGSQAPSNDNGDSSSKRKRRQQRFAKYIVEGVCMLAEKGFVWYANKDINDAKLAEYEVSGEIDLTLLVTLESGQEATIKQFFQQQCFSAESLSKFSKEEKEDLTDALVEVLIEKNFEPTASQNLALVAGEILVKKGLDLLMLTSQTNSLLAQLKNMSGERASHTDVTEKPAPKQEPIAQEEKSQPAEQEEKNEEPLQTQVENALNNVEQEELGIMDSAKETKE